MNELCPLAFWGLSGFCCSNKDNGVPKKADEGAGLRKETRGLPSGTPLRQLTS